MKNAAFLMNPGSFIAFNPLKLLVIDNYYHLAYRVSILVKWNFHLTIPGDSRQNFFESLIVNFIS